MKGYFINIVNKFLTIIKSNKQQLLILQVSYPFENQIIINFKKQNLAHKFALHISPQHPNSTLVDSEFKTKIYMQI